MSMVGVSASGLQGFRRAVEAQPSSDTVPQDTRHDKLPSDNSQQAVTR
jgi:hypothetical protein